MRCFYHEEIQATHTCTDCGKPLCEHCSKFFVPPLCVDCAKRSNDRILNEAKKKAYLNLVVFAVGCIWFFFSYIFDGMNLFIAILGCPIGGIFALSLFGIPAGWKALDKITPSIFLILPLIGWVIYFIIKLVLSMLFAAFILPYRTIKALLEVKKSTRLDEYVKSVSDMTRGY